MDSQLPSSKTSFSYDDLKYKPPEERSQFYPNQEASNKSVYNQPAPPIENINGYLNRQLNNQSQPKNQHRHYHPAYPNYSGMNSHPNTGIPAQKQTNNGHYRQPLENFGNQNANAGQNRFSQPQSLNSVQGPTYNNAAQRPQIVASNPNQQPYMYQGTNFVPSGANSLNMIPRDPSCGSHRNVHASNYLVRATSNHPQTQMNPPRPLRPIASSSWQDSNQVHQHRQVAPRSNQSFQRPNGINYSQYTRTHPTIPEEHSPRKTDQSNFQTTNGHFSQTSNFQNFAHDDPDQSGTFHPQYEDPDQMTGQEAARYYEEESKRVLNQNSQKYAAIIEQSERKDRIIPPKYPPPVPQYAQFGASNIMPRHTQTMKYANDNTTSIKTTNGRKATFLTQQAQIKFSREMTFSGPEVIYFGWKRRRFSCFCGGLWFGTKGRRSISYLNLCTIDTLRTKKTYS